MKRSLRKQSLMLYSTSYKTTALLPGTLLLFTFYPAKIVWTHLTNNLEESVGIASSGIISKSQQYLLLDKGQWHISGVDSKTPFSYRIFLQDNQVILQPKQPLTILKNGKKIIIKAKELFSLTTIDKSSFCSNKERLFLGKSKTADIVLMSRRFDLAEILPYIFAIGQDYQTDRVFTGGIFDRLYSLKTYTEPNIIEEQLLQLMHIALPTLLEPHIEDDYHQGLALSPFIGDKSAAYAAIYAELYRYIRALFIRYEDQKLYLLEKLLPSLHVGKLSYLNFSFGTVTLRWSKKQLFSLQIEAKKDTTIFLKACNIFKSYRLTNSNAHQSMRRMDSALELKSQDTYYLDRFTK